ncbi:hypothetical protein ACHAW6_011557 [Cyclotella cf. meneghiniana]
MRSRGAVLSLVVGASVPSRYSVLAFAPTFHRDSKCNTSLIPTGLHLIATPRSTSTSTTRTMATKAGVATPAELASFVSSAGSRLLVIDVRHPDPAVEPGDAKSLAVAGFPDKVKNYRPMAINLPWNRETNQMDLPENVQADTPIITHCGGGGRGQLAKDFLEKNGFTNVLNGGGPKEKECWAEYGYK